MPPYTTSTESHKNEIKKQLKDFLTFSRNEK